MSRTLSSIFIVNSAHLASPSPRSGPDLAKILPRLAPVLPRLATSHPAFRLVSSSFNPRLVLPRLAFVSPRLRLAPPSPRSGPDVIQIYPSLVPVHHHVKMRPRQTSSRSSLRLRFYLASFQPSPSILSRLVLFSSSPRRSSALKRGATVMVPGRHLSLGHRACHRYLRKPWFIELSH